MKDGRSKPLGEFDNDVAKALHDANTSMIQGTSFALVMDHEGEKTVYYRSRQPCYGECRKYFKSHKDYTDPAPHDEYRPGDLHDPFPVGKPIGVSFGWNGRMLTEEKHGSYIRRMFGEKSPFLRGFHSPEDVELTIGDGGTIFGVVLKNTHVDPTVMINLMQVIRMGFGANSLEVVEAFEDEFMKLCVPLVFWPQEMYGQKGKHIFQRYMPNYYTAVHPDIVRIEEQNPRSLSGGTGWFDEGSDYNRKILHDLFAVENVPEGTKPIGNVYCERNKNSNAFDYSLARDLIYETLEKQRAA